MKKLVLIGVIAVAVISTSCRKERTCDCKTTETTVRTGYEAGTYIETSQYKVTMSKQKRDDFKLSTNCVSRMETHTENGGSGSKTYTDFVTNETDCELK